MTLTERSRLFRQRARERGNEPELIEVHAAKVASLIRDSNDDDQKISERAQPLAIDGTLITSGIVFLARIGSLAVDIYARIAIEAALTAHVPPIARLFLEMRIAASKLSDPEISELLANEGTPVLAKVVAVARKGGAIGADDWKRIVAVLRKRQQGEADVPATREVIT
jgi:hypothetical protein